MKRSKKDAMLLLPPSEGAAKQDREKKDEVGMLIANAEKRSEIDEEARTLQRMCEEAKELSRSADKNRNALIAAVNLFKNLKVAFDAAIDSADNIVSGITAAIVRSENVTIKVELTDEAKKTLAKHQKAYIDEEKKLMLEHREEIERLLERQQKRMREIAGSHSGIYLTGKSVKWIVLIWTLLSAYFCITVILYFAR